MSTWWEWVLAGAGVLLVYCLGFVVTVGIVTRRCRYAKYGHRHRGETWEDETVPCNHLSDTAYPSFWPLVLVAMVAFGAVCLPFVGPVWATRRASQKLEARIKKRQALT